MSLYHFERVEEVDFDEKQEASRHEWSVDIGIFSL